MVGSPPPLPEPMMVLRLYVQACWGVATLYLYASHHNIWGRTDGAGNQESPGTVLHFFNSMVESTLGNSDWE